MNRRLLLADDRDAIRDSLSEILALEGYDVVTARDGHEALMLLRDQPFDAALLDVRMPGHSGFDIAARLGDDRPPIVLMTAYGYDDEHVTATHVTAVLHKPVSVPNLLDLLVQTLSPAS